MSLDAWRWRLLRLNAGVLHRLRLRLTPAGLLVLCAMTAAGVWGFDTTQSMTFQAFALCAALL
ncbi:MAG: hypothetical protein KGL53_09470, partial [Elusimicrobia bacterium]|nr:hypothetical protein [Elusimicrobiota bacterium]